jgi:toxin ParE1/3/4
VTRVLWSQAALFDLQRIYDYIALFNPGAGRMMVDRLVAEANGLVAFPRRGRPVPGTTLRELTFVYPYIIRYRIDVDTVFVLRVRHGRRQPI